jgi:hypothetical protein
MYLVVLGLVQANCAGSKSDAADCSQCHYIIIGDNPACFQAYLQKEIKKPPFGGFSRESF